MTNDGSERWREGPEPTPVATSPADWRLAAEIRALEIERTRQQSAVRRLQNELTTSLRGLEGARAESAVLRAAVERAGEATRIEQRQVLALRAALQAREAAAAGAEAELARLRRSMSWRVTAPLRTVVSRLHRLRARRPAVPAALQASGVSDVARIEAAPTGETLTVEALGTLSRDA